MAGITSTVGLNAILAGATKTVSHRRFSDKTKLFGLPLYLAELSIVSLSPYHRRSPAIICRYGGGGGGGGSRFPGDRRGRQKESDDDDDALDISAIRSATVRLIDGQQNMIGVVSKEEAVRRAEDAELDLVILSPDADPPVVRMMDYSKYRYEQQKRKKEQQKKTTRMDLKELKMGYNIDQHDYSVRMRAARKFLQDGDKVVPIYLFCLSYYQNIHIWASYALSDYILLLHDLLHTQVKVIVNMKGRENEFRNIAIELLRRFQNEVGELATEESKNFRDRNLFIVLVPNKEIIRKAQEPPSKKKKKPAGDEVSAAGINAT
ncbi:translation initiation factor IF3-4, chloroplastic isoform X1 [Eutrema salsugineum]|uniref:translation initiation factor IF3-4, chloroplastic isoform X1 n=1 Tax=Eutrema salsugineum TaxID=72664 RepID=UPI000CECE66C|nr:translation initiation factor IF3-4, chloroplastic isoform X1 [Eutrema salsugineum]